MSTFAERIREARRSAGLTQLDLARECGLTRGAVALWESGGIASTQPRPDLLRKVTQILKVPFEWLMDDSVDPESAWYLPNRPVSDPERQAALQRERDAREGYQVSYMPGPMRGDPAERAERGRIREARASRGILDLIPDVLPDLEQDGYLFVFAKTAQQVENKLDVLARASADLKKHLVLIGCESEVHCAKDPGEALAKVVQILKKA